MKMKMKMKAKANELPFTLIEFNILPRLSVKCVGRCMCVCKQWKSVLSTPMFARMHLEYHTTINDYKLLLLDGQPPVTFRTLDVSKTIRPNLNPDPTAEFILATLNGLVCLGSRKPTFKLAFWNPLTGAYKELSSSPHLLFSEDFARDVIGFYTDSCNDYKLVCLIRWGRCGAHIYSHRLDSWREIEFSVGSNDPCTWSTATFWGQCVYFTVTYIIVTDDMFGSDSWVICFDVKTETFRRIPFPPVPGDVRGYSGSLVVLNGSLHLCISYEVFDMNGKHSKQGDVWRMDGDADGDGWAKVATFTDPPTYYPLRRQHICTMSTGNWLAVLEENNLFRIMNTEDFTRRYWYFCSPSWEYRSRRMIYVETLVSPKS